MSPGRSGWQGRSVLLTGHTGFKGGWLSLWLHQLGARVHGYALDPPTQPNLFEAGRIRSLLASHTHADIADLGRLESVVGASQPEVIFHLAAQPLVRAGYSSPIATLTTNVLGTANLLEAARASQSVRAIVIITTDKVYENHGSPEPYREDAPLGGRDPYAASKASAEIVASSYRASFYSGTPGRARIATARAGNVIGGGDWATDRLVPDCLRAFANGQPVQLRYPAAVRPWQHVLEPLSGYLDLAERLLGPGSEKFEVAWNFGPDEGGDASVGTVADAIAHLWGEGAGVMHAVSEQNLHEDQILRLDSTRARFDLGWQPRWSLQQALEGTVAWHRAWMSGADMAAFSREQIREHQSARKS